MLSMALKPKTKHQSKLETRPSETTQRKTRKSAAETKRNKGIQQDKRKNNDPHN